MEVVSFHCSPNTPKMTTGFKVESLTFYAVSKKYV